MTQLPATLIKVFGGILFAVLLSLTIWSVFFDKHANDPLTPDEQQRADDMMNRARAISQDASTDE